MADALFCPTDPDSYEPSVAQLANRELITCSPDTPLHKAATLMHQHQISCILIKQGPEVIGIWTEADARKLDFQSAQSFSQPVCEVMSQPVIHIQENLSLTEAASLMLKKRIRRLLVLDSHQQPLGMLTQTDIVRQQRIEFFLRLRDVGSSISRLPLKLAADMPLADAAKALRQHQSDAAIVEFNDSPPGIITERDLITVIANNSAELSLGQCCYRPLLTVHKNCSLLQAVDMLKERNIRHLAVCNDQEQFCGLLSFSDILANVEYAYIDQLKKALHDRDSALRTSTGYLRLAQKVIDVSMDAIMITSPDGIIESVNPSFSQVTGYDAVEAIGQTPKLLSSGMHGKDFYRTMWQALHERGHWQGEIWNKRKNGDLYPQWLSVTAIRDEKKQITQFAAIFSDISERKNQERKIHQLAYVDELTGLANRRLFLDRLQLSIANAHRHQHKMAVLFLDLDLFKRINDTLGHQAGDQALKEVAHRLNATVREGESVARLGGDEFTILVPEIDNCQSLQTLAKRLVSQFDQPVRLKGQDFFLTTSIGISLYPKDGKSAEQLIKHADLAMYEAKNAGRNQYCFYQSRTGQQTADELKMEQALRHALHHHQLAVHYQPKICLKTNQIRGFEALVRWHHSDYGMIAPADFIPLAEKLGLISALGEQVLEQVCKDINSHGLLGLPVSVNVSALQLADPTFCRRLCLLLGQHHVTNGRIELELTESCLIPEQADSTMRLLTELRKQGFRLSIDDFGTGYSSLSYLRRLPIDTLKIDRSFISELPENEEDSQITLAIIAMAKALGLEVIAEGIETPVQRQFLLQSGCLIGQGYLFWPALPVEALPLKTDCDSATLSLCQ
ncbi:EAL domain-containing protein [Lacimicrobium alkaliphilum]|uniref:Diguanylate cyclase n=1 Tax=Lacimicrobium alkaliphilum TaxID=1526571 RepID=A0A0U3B8H9_9ALTE|nr:EAL domain-containing protein [Lacimicrobium alkaliphilum]ALS97973.1 diguanylate cyclase [Lacimicrobium alkaliphilum]